MTSTFTVVCVYNSEPTLEKYLRPGLCRQRGSFDLRLVDNRSHRFSSAAAALNFGAQGSTTDFLVFLHQDVELLTPDFFEVASVYLSGVPRLGVAGVVGAAAEGRSTILRGRCLQGDASAHGFTPGFDQPEPTQTVDELLMIVPRTWFEHMHFDPRACPAWDLYGAEYALSCARHARDVVVVPLPVRHASWGRLRRSYFETLASVQAKHPQVPTLHTTCGTWRRGRGPCLHWAAHKTNSARKLAVKRISALLSS